MGAQAEISRIIQKRTIDFFKVFIEFVTILILLVMF